MKFDDFSYLGKVKKIDHIFLFALQTKITKLILISTICSLFLCVINAYSQKNNIDEVNNNKSKKVSLSIVSYNVWGLPIWIPGIKKKERFPKIIDNLRRVDADIVCLQETFEYEFRKKHMSKLSDDYTLNKDYLANKKKLFKVDKRGGLNTLVKTQYQILEEYFFPFGVEKGMSKVEKNGGKGFVIIKIETPIGVINMINTHLLAGDDEKRELLRLSQAKRMKVVIDSLQLFESPTFLCGDLNTIHPSREENVEYVCKVYRYFVDSIGFKGVYDKITEKDFSYDGKSNKYATSWYKKGIPLEKIDYFLYAVPDEYFFKIEESKVIFNGEKASSDHCGVWTKIFLEKK